MSVPLVGVFGNILSVLVVLALVLVVLRFYKVRSLVSRLYRWFSDLWESDKKDWKNDSDRN